MEDDTEKWTKRDWTPIETNTDSDLDDSNDESNNE